MFQGKTQTTENGPVLLKGCNAVLGHLGTSLRASWEAVVRGVASLGKDQAITCVLQHYGQPLPNSLNSQLSHGRSTSLQRIVVIAVTSSLLLFVATVSANSYRWKDKDGNTHYGASVPAEYADQPYDVLNSAGVVIERVEDTSEPPQKRAARLIKERTPFISDEQRQLQSDRLLFIQYDSEADIQKALNFAISQLGYESKILHQSSDSAATAIRDQIRMAADQQRAGLQISTKKQKQIDKLYQRLAQDETKISALQRRDAMIRTRFESVLERYRLLTSEDQESETEQVDQG